MWSNHVARMKIHPTKPGGLRMNSTIAIGASSRFDDAAMSQVNISGVVQRLVKKFHEACANAEKITRVRAVAPNGKLARS